MDMFRPASDASRPYPSRSSPPVGRTSSAIEEAIWACLRRDNPAAFNPDQIEVWVEDGRVCLTGHVTETRLAQRADVIAGRVSGVTSVENEIVVDEVLCRQVVRALAHSERTAPYLFPVQCHLGWISLGGLMPALEVVRAAEEVTALVPGVRGIIGLPWVIGLLLPQGSDPEPARRTFQPWLGSPVYQLQNNRWNLEVGQVTQVVIDPRSRLVCRIGVRPAGAQARFERLAPVEAIEAANGQGVWLLDGIELTSLPAFDHGQFPLAPRYWRPPFPYRAGSVRWPAQI